MKRRNMDSEKLAILKLSRTFGFTSTVFYRLLRGGYTVRDMVEKIDQVCRKDVKICSDENIQLELEKCNKLGAKLITCKDNEYPRSLMMVPPFPLVLTCLGNTKLLAGERRVAIVGSRECSINTFNFTKAVARKISSYGYIVVSGLAKGVDAASHIGSLENGTIAILGNSIENVYPRENEYLYQKILESNGLLVSEFPLGTRPKPENFPIRNKTIAGMSRGVLIVSAGLGSGSLYTANQALKYNREVLVFPGSPYDTNYIGSNKLIQQGATIVLTVEDVIENLESSTVPGPETINFRDLCPGPSIEPGKEGPPEPSLKLNYGDSWFYRGGQTPTENCDEIPGDDESTVQQDPEQQTVEELLLSKLDYYPIDIAMLVDSVSLDVGEINATLMKLSLEGKISIEHGKVCRLRVGPGDIPKP
ncbi:MAG: DNA-processing protein DprA [Rickettsiales bacterium]|jgi:DNA processing protein|nr:DNA-processing protein DprA [Rickettsiales bacterium]